MSYLSEMLAQTNVIGFNSCRRPLSTEMVYGSRRGDSWTYYGYGGIELRFISSGTFPEKVVYSDLVAMVAAEKQKEIDFWRNVKDHMIIPPKFG